MNLLNQMLIEIIKSGNSSCNSNQLKKCVDHFEIEISKILFHLTLTSTNFVITKVKIKKKIKFTKVNTIKQSQFVLRNGWSFVRIRR